MHPYNDNATTPEDRFVAKLATAVANRDKGAATAETMAKIGKGEHAGECAMEVCRNGDALWYNRSTRRYYCGACALLLNTLHYAEAKRLYNSTLCVFRPEAR